MDGKPTKAFISYSWTSEAHKAWVHDLATELRQQGVDAILDQWDLKDGHEANAFMESMVTDPEIQKVIIIADNTYVQKADNRQGGAGAEAQIISGKIFAQEKQEKFVVVSTELDGTGQPCRPAYYTSRLFIDFTDHEKYGEKFERLLRWIYEKPELSKPDLGAPPAFLFEQDAIVLATNPSHRRAMEAIRTCQPQAIASTKEYFNLLIEEMEKFRMPSAFAVDTDEMLINLSSFLPYRKEVIEILGALARYSSQAETGGLVHDFFEHSLRYFHDPEGWSRQTKYAVDNFKLFIHELFLYATSIFIEEGRVDLFNALVDSHYYDKVRARNGGKSMHAFTYMRQHLHYFSIRKEKLGLNRHCLHADILKERSAGSGVDFSNLMQADFLLYLREGLLLKEDDLPEWWPVTLVYATRGYGVFELFDRAQSENFFFHKVAPFLRIEFKDQLKDYFAALRANPNRLPSWQMDRIIPWELAGYDKLCTLR